MPLCGGLGPPLAQASWGFACCAQASWHCATCSPTFLKGPTLSRTYCIFPAGVTWCLQASESLFWPKILVLHWRPPQRPTAGLGVPGCRTSQKALCTRALQMPRFHGGVSIELRAAGQEVGSAIRSEPKGCRAGGTPWGVTSRWPDARASGRRAHGFQLRPKPPDTPADTSLQPSGTPAGPEGPSLGQMSG